MKVGDLIQFVERPHHLDPTVMCQHCDWHDHCAILLNKVGDSCYNNFAECWCVLLENGEIKELYSKWMEVIHESD
jgi:hypothetical protein